MPNMVDVGWLLNSIKNMRSSDMGKRLVCDSLTEMVINNTVDAVPVVHAHWIRSEDADDGYCSVCHCDMPMYREDWKWKYVETPFCPHCGAIMDEPIEK